ncbi:unnamed protein product [Moneuplotes crassus]|uniref:Uncharacterized protein n=1 Tax=Euplotes crassus TaxID=5936 RepID=A0AAD1Y6F1_EUPCR|nr:unnamed protein product [Moneuplotes crassus]
MSEIGLAKKHKKLAIKKQNTGNKTNGKSKICEMNTTVFDLKKRLKKNKMTTKLNKIRRIPKKYMTDPKKIMKSRFNRIKSCSHEKKVFEERLKFLRSGTKEKQSSKSKKIRNIPKFNSLSRKPHRFLSPAVKLINKLILREANSGGSSWRKNSKRRTPSKKLIKKRIKFNLRAKLSRLVKPEKLKKSHKVNISKIFGGSANSSLKPAMAENKRYSHICTIQPYHEQKEHAHRRMSEFVHIDSEYQNFEVYKSMNQDKGSVNIQDKFLPDHRLDSTKGLCFPNLANGRCVEVLDAFSPR